MVRALDGRKTQTRRLTKPNEFEWPKSASRQIDDPGVNGLNCRYGQPGDQLWVRETFCAHWGAPPHDAPQSYRIVTGDKLPPIKQENGDFYQPVPSDIMTIWYEAEGNKPFHMKWKPSIHMHRWASRITLRITDIRVERLQDVSEDDARAEGCPYPAEWAGRFVDRDETAKTWFKSLWNNINGPGAWDDNPWVWVISFERMKP
jgi:hypothetical protein